MQLSLDQALSHTAVFFLHFCLRCLPLWCATFCVLFLVSEHFTLHLQNCPHGWQGACTCSHAICSCMDPPPPPPGLNGAGASYWFSGDWFIQDTHTRTHSKGRTCLFVSVYAKSILKELKLQCFIYTGLVLHRALMWCVKHCLSFTYIYSPNPTIISRYECSVIDLHAEQLNKPPEFAQHWYYLGFWCDLWKIQPSSVFFVPWRSYTQQVQCKLPVYLVKMRQFTDNTKMCTHL